MLTFAGFFLHPGTGALLLSNAVAIVGTVSATPFAGPLAWALALVSL